jgi:hypothetical protein
MLVTRGLGGIWPGAVVAGLGSYSGVIPPEPAPSGGGGSKKPWRVDYLEDYPGYYRPEPAPVVKKARAPRKVPQGPAQIVTPWELLDSFGIKPEQAPVIARPLVQEPAPKPITSRAEALAIMERFRAKRLADEMRLAAEMAEAERLRLLRQRNAAAFLLLM